MPRVYLEDARAFRDNGIGILGSFVLGYDGDTPAVFDAILRFCEEARLEAAIFPILTPYPGTRSAAGWRRRGGSPPTTGEDYDMGHVNFHPAGMTAEELQAGHDWLNSSFYSFSSMYRRIFKLHRSLQVFAPMNFGFRSAMKKTREGDQQAAGTEIDSKFSLLSASCSLTNLSIGVSLDYELFHVSGPAALSGCQLPMMTDFQEIRPTRAGPDRARPG